MMDVPETALSQSQTRVRKLLERAQRTAEALRRAADAQNAEQYALLLGAAELLAVELQAGIAQQRERDTMLGVAPDDDEDLELEPFDLIDDRSDAERALEKRTSSLDEDES